MLNPHCTNQLGTYKQDKFAWVRCIGLWGLQKSVHFSPLQWRSHILEPPGDNDDWGRGGGGHPLKDGSVCLTFHSLNNNRTFPGKQVSFSTLLFAHLQICSPLLQKPQNPWRWDSTRHQKCRRLIHSFYHVWWQNKIRKIKQVFICDAM